MKIYVVGGVSYWNDIIKQTLFAVHAETPITMLLQGGLSGVDMKARTWAYKNKIPFETHDLEKPIPEDVGLVLAFFGKEGTQARIAEAMGRGLPLKVIPHPVKAAA